MITFSKRYRSNQSEIIDNLALQGSEMEAMLADLETVNRTLGGHHVTIDGIQTLLKETSKNNNIVIADIGCGDGAMLREIADFGLQNGYQFTLVGIDANAHILEKARQSSKAYKNISYAQETIFDGIPANNYDITLCTLFLHHFGSKDCTSIIKTLTKASKVGVVINDLHRNWLAFWGFRLFSSIFIKTAIAKHDGLVSVARSFKRRELDIIAKKSNIIDYTIAWKWAFRWQFIIKTAPAN